MTAKGVEKMILRKGEGSEWKLENSKSPDLCHKPIHRGGSLSQRKRLMAMPEGWTRARSWTKILNKELEGNRQQGA